jgi:nicotinamidase-related amidase
VVDLDLRPLQWSTTAVVLVSLQKDLFDPGSVLRPAFEEPESLDRVLARTIAMLRDVEPTSATIVSAPVCFSDDYAELPEPVGLLAAIVEAKALRAGQPGSDIVDAIRAFGERIHEVRPRPGFDAFATGDLDPLLRAGGVRDVLFAGGMSSLSVDATARTAAILGYRVGILADCTIGRSSFEHEFYCEHVFPLYGDVLRSADLGVSRVALHA